MRNTIPNFGTSYKEEKIRVYRVENLDGTGLFSTRWATTFAGLDLPEDDFSPKHLAAVPAETRVFAFPTFAALKNWIDPQLWARLHAEGFRIRRETVSGYVSASGQQVIYSR